MRSHLRSESGQPLSKDASLHVTNEVWNTIISAVGALLAILGVASLIKTAVEGGKFWHILAFSIYGFGLISVFVLSTLHHGVSGSPRTDRILRQLDYLAIYFKIPGTLTPFCLILFRDPFGWSVLFGLWFLSIVSFFLKMFYPQLPKRVENIFYVGLGCLSGVIIFPIFKRLLWPAGVLLLLGGFFYLLGSSIYYREKPNPFPGKFGFHEIWHLHVLAGSASHFAAIYFYLLPYPS